MRRAHTLLLLLPVGLVFGNPGHAHASGDGGEWDLVGAGEVLLVGAAIPVVVVGTYALAGGDTDGVWVPPAFAWVEVATAVGLFSAGAVWEDSENGAPGPWAFGMILGGSLLGSHAIISFSEYEPGEVQSHLSLTVPRGGGALASWALTF
jgi:hypothetical protein